MESSKSRLTKSDYLRRGLDVLAAEGPRSLTAARMARELNVTKGSFYWHFESVDSFRDDLKRFWHDDVVIGIITQAKAYRWQTFDQHIAALYEQDIIDDEVAKSYCTDHSVINLAVDSVRSSRGEETSDLGDLEMAYTRKVKRD